ncbi:sensor histidine kinase [Mucilaginibacter sp.]|uniref:sensor histidine kinase n=1 Tax=Mucilaginibacter sp. TaxID=1882438 RepID=UPI0035BC448F
MKYSKIEFWVATAFFALMMYVGVNQGFSSYGSSLGRGQQGLNYLLDYLLPNLSMVVVTYAAFLTINYYILPNYWFNKKHTQAIGLILVVFAATGTVYTVDQSYLRYWIYTTYNNGYSANMALFSRGFSMAFMFLLIYVVYVFMREGILYQHRQYLLKQSLKLRILGEVLLTCSVWLAVLAPLLVLRNTGLFRMVGPVYILVLPFCFTLYFLNRYWLIPNYRKGVLATKFTYTLSLIALSVGLGCVEAAMFFQIRLGISFLGFIVIAWLPQVLITTAISWAVYLANEDKYKQFTLLKTALGASDANLQVLRSQINPHFLFNVLNSLYGTALSEQAEKTGEGIQKLGDMMRFMLHENTQDSISLSREIAYLHNYIDLQNLRIAVSDNVQIKTDITGTYNALNIAPMLLIPFIENAYKHGISFKQQSWINTSLQLNGNTLQLDVYNSVHPDKNNDPEKRASGIGLDNVKQRLQLLYPKKHELVIRQNPSEFFIHLTLQLS